MRDSAAGQQEDDQPLEDRTQGVVTFPTDILTKNANRPSEDQSGKKKRGGTLKKRPTPEVPVTKGKPSLSPKRRSKIYRGERKTVPHSGLGKGRRPSGGV